VVVRLRPSLLRRSAATFAAVGAVLAPASVALGAAQGGVAPDPSPSAGGGRIAPDPAPGTTRIAPTRARTVAPEPSTSAAAPVRTAGPTIRVAAANESSAAQARANRASAAKRAAAKPKRAAAPTAKQRPQKVSSSAPPSRHDESFGLPASPAAKDARTPLLAGLGLLALVAASLSLLGTARRLGAA
jgi:hypothetical protein